MWHKYKSYVSHLPEVILKSYLQYFVPHVSIDGGRSDLVSSVELAEKLRRRNRAAIVVVAFQQEVETFGVPKWINSNHFFVDNLTKASSLHLAKKRFEGILAYPYRTLYVADRPPTTDDSESLVLSEPDK